MDLSSRYSGDQVSRSRKRQRQGTDGGISLTLSDPELGLGGLFSFVGGGHGESLRKEKGGQWMEHFGGMEKWEAGEISTLRGAGEFEARVVVRREEVARPSRSVDNIPRGVEEEEERGESCWMVVGMRRRDWEKLQKLEQMHELV